VSKTIERAQTSVEGYNFDIRKHLLEYDDVLNRQRETIYAERLYILRADDLQHQVWRMIEGQVDEYVAKYSTDPEQRRLIFGALDDVVPLLLPPPNGPFQGPLAFGAHLTARVGARDTGRPHPAGRCPLWTGPAPEYQRGHRGDARQIR